MTTLQFIVRGVPGAQGSKRHVGHGVMIESNKRTKPWRSDVKTAAEQAIAAYDTFVPWTPLPGPVAVHVTFWFVRPKSHYRTGRNAHILRDDAPAYVTSRGAGDIDKLERSTYDALVAAGVIADDSLIVRTETAKWYCDPGETPGASIRVTDLR